MQDIVFYATANETLGTVRDYANIRILAAPVLTLGVSVCLRMRLFADTNSVSPYPIDSLGSIEEWKWSMDGDFNRDTTCKLVADADGISVHTVTDTINGTTLNFTEFVIPISNMNTEELAAWIGNEKTRSGLTGELVGYDSNANAAFVLQIEDFTVRNRVAGLGDPTALDQEIVTHAQAVQMIQSAVSASAAGKQDKLTSSNGGTGISVSSEGIISVSDIPQSAVRGLATELAGKQPAISSGATMDINITGNAATATTAVTAATATNAMTATNATSASLAGYATSAGTAGALAAGVVVASASAATTAGTASTATSATSAGYATSAGTAGSATSAGTAGAVTQAVSSAIIAAAIESGGGGGGGDYATSAGYASSAGGLSSGASVNGATVSFTNIPQSAITGLSTDLAGKQDKLTSGGSYSIKVDSASEAATAGYAIMAGSLSAGVSVDSATNATNAVNAANAASAVNAASATTASGLTSGTSVNGATVTFTNIPQSAVTNLTTDLAGKQPAISSGATMDISITGNAATATTAVTAATATNAMNATNATSAASAGYAASAGTAGALAAGVVVASASAATTAGTATNATSAASAGYATSAGTAGELAAGVVVASASSAGSAASAGKFTGTWSSGSIPQSALDPYQTINTNTTGATVTILPGHAYKIDATTSSKTIAIDSFDVGKYGREAHLELFVANIGYVHTGSNVTLVDPLEPDAVNNCTVRFHDGHAIISVEDHVEAYMVNDAGATNTSGTLLYGLGQTGDTYKFIGFRSELNGSVISTGSGAPTVVKHVVGNGMDVGPTISGSISVANGATLRDLKVSDLNLTSGTLSLGEVVVVSGSTVGATSASAILKLQHVAGEGRIYANSNTDLNGAQIDCYVQTVSGLPTISGSLQFGGSGTLDLNGTKLLATTANANVYISGMTCTNGGLNTSAGGFAMIQSGATATFSNCLITGNTSTTQGGGVYLLKASATFDGCSFVGNDAGNGQGAYIASSATMNLVNCNFTHARGTRAQNLVFAHATASATIAGVCKFTALVSRANASTSGTLIISSGAVVDLSGNSTSVPVIPGGRIIVDGGCTVINSAGVDVHINGGTYTQIDNLGTAS